MKLLLLLLVLFSAWILFHQSRPKKITNISRESVKVQADECVRRGLNFDQCKEYLRKEGFKKGGR